MRFTLETTVAEPQYSQKVVIEVPREDVGLDEICCLLDSLLRGFNFNFEGQLKIVNEESE